MNIKASLAVVTLAVAGLTAAAQDKYAKMYVYPDEITVSDDGMAKVDVWYDTNVTTLNCFEFWINIPEGFTLEKNSRGNVKYTLNPDEDVVFDHVISFGDHTDEPEHFFKVVGASYTNAYLGTGEHMLFSINIVVPGSFTYSDYPDGVKCSLSRILVVENDLNDLDHPIEYFPEESVFTVLPKDVSTGICGINADAPDSGEIIYDLKGVRVYRPLSPGLYIVNGVKELVR